MKIAGLLEDGAEIDANGLEAMLVVAQSAVPQKLLVPRARLGEGAAHLQADGEVEDGLWVTATAVNVEGPKNLYRFRDTARRSQREPEVVRRRHVLRLDSQRVLKCGNGVVECALL